MSQQQELPPPGQTLEKIAFSEGASTSVIGKPLLRKEDPRLITGLGKFVDDIKFPRMLHCAFLRSSYAHAKIRGIDVSQALSSAGVKMVVTAIDLPQGIASSLPSEETSDGVEIRHPLLAEGEATYAGEPLAYVVAETRYNAEDAVELINVDYDILPVVIDPQEALKENSPKARSNLKSNIVKVERRSSGDVEAAFSKASKFVREEYTNQRLAPSPIEPRGCIASFDEGHGTVNVWISSQAPFQVRADVSEMLRLPENKVRVIVPEVGGAFGAKISLYAEEVLVSLASMKLGRPVKWIETRSENFLSMTQGRGQTQSIELAATDKGRILGLKVKIIGDAGSYLTEGSSDSVFTIRMVPGCYTIPAYVGETFVVLTNKVPHDAYRGASRPEATYLIERAMDDLARELKIDPADLRLRNFVPREDFPYETVGGFEYDSGDYAMNLRRALELSGYERWREEQRSLRTEGRLIGIGLATYVEVCAFGPDFPQTAAISVNSSGQVIVVSGTSPHGQGHETPFAQIVSERLGIPVEDVSVTYGDTAILPWGTFTAGSRSAALGGSAVLMSAEKIRSKMAKIAAYKLKIPEEEIEFRERELVSSKDRSKKLSFQKVAYYAQHPEKLPPGMEPVLYAFSAFAPPNYTFPFGTHVVVVELERETGRVKILEYTSVDDCGKVLNPLIVEGQIQGGITQGLGQALLEGVKYDDQSGQLLTANFIDYQIPLAEDTPLYRTFRTETPTPANELGIKGIGEAGTIAATPAIVNAVADALSPLEVKVREMPLTPDYVKRLIGKS